jgi:hypothetical protein
LNEEQQSQGQPGQPTEEELRAALEEEMRRVTVDDILLQSAVSMVNLGGRKAGLAPGTEGERDLGQVQAAIDGVSALLPVLDKRGREEVGPIREALSQLQMAYAQLAGGGQEPPGGEGEGGGPEGGSEPEPEPPKPGGPGSAQSSGRLWVPGQ